MKRESLEQLLQRAKVRDMPEERLSGYAEQVRRRLTAQPSTVVRVRPQLGWWMRWLVSVAAAMGLMIAVWLNQPARSLQLADGSLEEEAAILSVLSPEDDALLLDDEAIVLEELERLEAELSVSG